MLDSQEAGTAPAQKETQRQTLSGLDSALEAYLTAAEDNPPSAMTTYNMVDNGHKEQ